MGRAEASRGEGFVVNKSGGSGGSGGEVFKMKGGENL